MGKKKSHNQLKDQCGYKKMYMCIDDLFDQLGRTRYFIKID